MWFALAAARAAMPRLARAASIMAGEVTPVEIAEAERLAEASGLAP